MLSKRKPSPGWGGGFQLFNTYADGVSTNVERNRNIHTLTPFRVVELDRHSKCAVRVASHQKYTMFRQESQTKTALTKRQGGGIF